LEPPNGNRGVIQPRGKALNDTDIPCLLADICLRRFRLRLGVAAQIDSRSRTLSNLPEGTLPTSPHPTRAPLLSRRVVPSKQLSRQLQKRTRRVPSQLKLEVPANPTLSLMPSLKFPSSAFRLFAPAVIFAAPRSPDRIWRPPRIRLVALRSRRSLLRFRPSACLVRRAGHQRKRSNVRFAAFGRVHNHGHGRRRQPIADALMQAQRDAVMVCA
jgi:hypothetical protein